MNLSAPTKIVFIIAVVAAIIGLLGYFGVLGGVGVSGIHSFWFAFLAWGLLTAGNLLKKF